MIQAQARKPYSPLTHTGSFVAEAFKHGKAIGAAGDGLGLLRAANLNGSEPGVVTAEWETPMNGFAKDFIRAIAEHRHWDRPQDQVPA